MKTNKLLVVLLLCLGLCNCKNDSKNKAISDNSTVTKANDEMKIIPIQHGTLIIESESEVIYIDPTGGTEAFKGQKPATMVVITDIHGDHLSLKTLETLNLNSVPVIVPKAVSDKIPNSVITAPQILNNGETTEIHGISIEAIPMYNLREEALKFHEKGRGNGYVFTINDKRIYISGDTEDIPEMRNLENIDKAFVCMNLPYTMPVENAASAVLDFQPKQVYPYHYRGSEGKSDINKFKALVYEGNSSIEVILLDWYN